MGTVLVFLSAILFLAGLFLLPRTMLKRAARTVIARFRAHGALSEEKAKTAQELGLVARPFLERMGLRDYTPAALQGLKEADIVRTTTVGKMYLDEGRLAVTKLAKQQGR